MVCSGMYGVIALWCVGTVCGVGAWAPSGLVFSGGVMSMGSLAAYGGSAALLLSAARWSFYCVSSMEKCFSHYL